MSNFVPNIQNAAPLECRPPLAGSAGAVVTPVDRITVKTVILEKRLHLELVLTHYTKIYQICNNIIIKKYRLAFDQMS
jgi:hypothetical protein